MHSLGVHINDSVTVAGRRASGEYHVVGRVVFPTLGAAQQLGDGAVFTGARICAAVRSEHLLPFPRRSLRGRGGSQRAATAHRRGAATLTPDRIDASCRDRSVASGRLAAGQSGDLARWPRAVCRRTCDRRGRCIAGAASPPLLKTLGFERRQVRATVGWQATTIGATQWFGAAVGVSPACPPGVALPTGSALQRTLPFPRSALS